METSVDLDDGITYADPIKWCRNIVSVDYFIVALVIAAHAIWYFAARSVLAYPPEVYARNYIFGPAVGLFALAILTDRLVRSPRLSDFSKEILPLSLIVVIAFYLCLTHDIARVLLGAFILPIFASTIFSDVRLTRWMFWMSDLAVLLLGIASYFRGRFDRTLAMQLFVACFMFLCAYLLAKILIRCNDENLMRLSSCDNKQQYMQERLKLDAFTGLNNKKTFDDSLPRFMEECRRADTLLSLAMIDIDNFKCVNDLYGHAAGDRVLLYLAQILEEAQTEKISAYRVGGDEFSLLFQDCAVEETYRVCDDLRAQMESCPLREVDERQVTFSCGVACTNPKDIDKETIVRIADSTLYEAKNNGRNRVVLHDDTI